MCSTICDEKLCSTIEQKQYSTDLTIEKKRVMHFNE